MLPVASAMATGATGAVTSNPLPLSNEINGTIFNDTNADGTFGGGETGLGSLQVRLIPSTGSTMTTTTSSSGMYSFKSLPSGNYVVEITTPTSTTVTVGGSDNDLVRFGVANVGRSATVSPGTSVGGVEAAGKMSPVNLLATTITDELRLFTYDRAKVVGLSLKDRGSIIPAGHHPTGAYWFDPNTLNFMTSTFYMSKLPLLVLLLALLLILPFLLF